MIRRFLHTASAIGDQGLVSGANFLLMVSISRCTPQVEFAHFVLSYTVVIFLGCLHLSLILQPLGMLLPERQGDARGAYLATWARFHRRIGIATLICASIAAWCSGLTGLLVWSVAAILARSCQEYERRAAYCLHNHSRALWIDCATYIPLVSVAVALIVWRPAAGATFGLMLLTLCNLLGAAVGAMLNAADSSHPPQPLWATLREHWYTGHWLVWGALLAALSDQLHPFLIAGLLGLHETALLAAARSITGIGNVAINGFDAFAGPRLRQLAVSEGLPALRKAAVHVGLLLVGALLVVAVPILIAPQWLMNVIYGASYRDAGWLLSAFALIFVVRGINKLLALLLLALKRPGSGFIAVAINAVATVILTPLWVKTFGLAGAVIGLAGNALVIAIVLTLGVRKTWREAQRDGVIGGTVPGLMGAKHD